MLKDYEKSVEKIENRVSELIERRNHVKPYTREHVELTERIYRLENILDELYQTIREIKRK